MFRGRIYPNSTGVDYFYDLASRVYQVNDPTEGVLHKNGSTVLDGATYTGVYPERSRRNKAGNRLTKANSLNSVTEEYTYDPLYQLTQVVQGSTTTESYSCDFVWNRLSSVGVPLYSYNPSNELTSNSTGSYTYDNNGNTLTDPSGKSYTWDFENRLTQVVVPGAGTVTFKYDPFGRRIQKSSPSGTINYLYDGKDICANAVEEVDSSGNALARYTQSPGIDHPLAELRSGTISYYQQDALGSVTSLSNAAAGLAKTYTYDSFGKLTSSTGTLVNPFQCGGRELDTETGIFYNRYRFYDQSIGRFTNEDPIEFGGGNNFYIYVKNNPVLLSRIIPVLFQEAPPGAS